MAGFGDRSSQLPLSRKGHLIDEVRYNTPIVLRKFFIIVSVGSQYLSALQSLAGELS
jgi:hypothetical protein